MKAKLDKVRELTSDDLVKRIGEIKESLFRLNFKKALGDNEVVKQLRRERKELARLLTLLRGRQLGIEK